MSKIKINNLDDETFAKVDMTLNQFGFENYCGACDLFETDDCPYKDKVDEYTDWRNFGCKKFFD